MEMLVYAGYALLLFVLWQFPEHSYSTNMGQPRLVNRGAAAFKQALQEAIPWKSMLLQLMNTESFISFASQA